MNSVSLCRISNNMHYKPAHIPSKTAASPGFDTVAKGLRVEGDGIVLLNEASYPTTNSGDFNIPVGLVRYS